MTSRTVHLGFEVGTFFASSSGDGKLVDAKRVEIPIRHMAVTGQTQESGKTTALTALISRSGLPAIAFITKRGEGEIPGRQILPYFHERADWQFVQSILESTMKERMKFERAWIVRACKGAKTLADVQRKVVLLEETAKNALSRDVYMLLGEYLQRVVPMLAALPQSDSIDLNQQGLGVMDLTGYPLELQMLVISSTLEWIHKHATGMISIIPEAWKFIPQGRNTPVRITAENLMREGAGLKNYVWIDSQDMAGVDKVLLRGCPVWLIGVQREANEIKRALSNMPAGLKKPRAEAVATLELGQFYACYGSEIRKTYVQPAWMDETAAGQIASGRLSVHDVLPLPPIDAMRREMNRAGIPHTTRAKQPAQAGTRPVESPAGSSARPGSPVPESGEAFLLRRYRETHSTGEPKTIAQEEEVSINPQTLQTLKLAIRDGAKDTALRLLDSLFSDGQPPEKARGPRSYTPEESFDNEQLYQAIKARLLKEAPALIKLTAEVPEIELTVLRKTVNMSTDSLDGNVARLIHEGFFESPRGNSETIAELNRRGWKTIAPRMSDCFGRFNKLGFLYQEDGKYRQVGDAKKRVVAA